MYLSRFIDGAGARLRWHGAVTAAFLRIQNNEKRKKKEENEKKQNRETK